MQKQSAPIKCKKIYSNPAGDIVRSIKTTASKKRWFRAGTMEIHWLPGRLGKKCQMNDDFRYMKIHIFALRWRDEIKRSSQLRTLLKRVVVNRTWKKIQARAGFELMTSAIPVQRSTNRANKPTGSWSMNWVQINIQVTNDDFRSKIIIRHLDVYLDPIHWPAPSAAPISQRSWV